MGQISIDTAMCGTVEIDDSNILHFDEPLLGFDKTQRFVILQTSHGPMFWLQSIEDPKLAFCILDPFEAGLDPDMSLLATDLAEIGAQSLEEVKVYSIVVLDPDPQQIRTNLRAPILVSTSSNKAKQVILDDQSLPVQLFLKDLVPEESA